MQDNKLDKEKFQELKEANEAIDRWGREENYKERARILEFMHKFEDADKDYAKRIKLIEEECFLDENYYELLSDAYLDKALAQENHLSHFKSKGNNNLNQMRISIVEDYDNSIQLLKKVKIPVGYSSKGVRVNSNLARSLFYRAKQKFYSNEFEDSISDLLMSGEYKKLEYKAGIWEERLKLLAESYLNIQDFNNVNKYIEILLKGKENHWDLYVYSAQLKKRMNDFKGAINDYTRAIEIDGYDVIMPGYSSFYKENTAKGDQLIQKGILKERLGQKESAFQDYIEAYRLDSTVISRHKSLFENEDLRQYLKDNHYN